MFFRPPSSILSRVRRLDRPRVDAAEALCGPRRRLSSTMVRRVEMTWVRRVIRARAGLIKVVGTLQELFSQSWGKFRHVLTGAPPAPTQAALPAAARAVSSGKPLRAARRQNGVCISYPL